MRRKDFLLATLTAAGAAASIAPRRRTDAKAATILSESPPTGQRPLFVRIFASAVVREVSVSGHSSLDVVLDGQHYAPQSIKLDASANSITLDQQMLAVPRDPIAVSGDQPLVVSAIGESQPLSVRRYAGALRMRLVGDALQVVNLAPIEAYVAGTLVAEASSSWSFEALRAQAIAVRTFALHAATAKSAREFDLKDDTSSQVYRGLDGISAQFDNAARSTTRQILTWYDAPAAVFYSSTCGGHTAEVAEIGGGALDYLGGVADIDTGGHAYCSAAPYFQWRNSLNATLLARVIDLPEQALGDCVVTTRWPDGRAKTLSIRRTDGSLQTMSGREFYMRCLQVLGYKVVPSTLFEISRSGDAFVIAGHGIGHGVGLCQWGARGRADAGAGALEILAAYFPGTTVKALASLDNFWWS